MSLQNILADVEPDDLDVIILSRPPSPTPHARSAPPSSSALPRPSPPSSKPLSSIKLPSVAIQINLSPPTSPTVAPFSSSPPPQVLSSPPPPSTVQPTASSSAPPSSTQQQQQQHKPKSKALSPPPLPPPPPPPRPTIRLEITLGGPDNYEVDILQLSKESGQLPPSPVVERGAALNSDGEGDSEAEENTTEKEKEKEKKDDVKVSKRGRKTAGQEYYDLHDPFIDDSELEVDERKYMAQTKQKGFYVSAGEVQLLKDKSAIPSSKLLLLSGKSPKKRGGSEMDTDLNGAGGGVNGKKRSANEEWATDGDGANGAVGGAANGSKKKRKTNEGEFSPETEALIADMKSRISAENWDNKGKFPPPLKPFLTKLAYQAILNEEYDEHFFAMMPKLFPYNKFTMTKLIKRLVYQDHYNYLQKRIDEKLVELKKIADEGFGKAKEEHDRSVVLWEKRVQRAKEAGANGVVPPPSGGEDEEMLDAPPPLPPLSQQAPSGEEGMEVDGATTLLPQKDSHPPPKRYRMTDTIRHLLWELVQLSNEGVRITNEKNGFENNNEVLSEQGVRKGLYQKIVAAFPDGWMNSGNISREVSAYKKKMEKEEE